MSKTILFDKIRRALTLARHAQRDGSAPAEVLERAAEARWNRRQFLQASAAAAGAALLPQWPAALPRLGGDPRVVIVGAGAAGLTAAYRLQGAGVLASVYEASPNRVGGRMLTLRDSFPAGQITELGGEFIDTAHGSLRRLARELGLHLADTWRAFDEEEETYYFGGERISFEQIVDEFRPVAEAIDAEWETLTGNLTYDDPGNAAAVDNLSISAWLEAHGIGGAIRSLLEVAYVGEYGLDADEQSAFNLLYLITTEPGTFEKYGESDERWHIREGNDSVPNRLADQLERPVEMDARLEAISRRANGDYVLTFNQAGAARDVRADSVILALPFTILREVDLRVDLPAVKREAIDTLGYGTNAKVIATFNERVWRALGSTGGSYTDLPYQSTWETVAYQRGQAGLLTNYLGGRAGVAAGEGRTSAHVTDWLDQLEAVFPGVKDAYGGQAVRFHWPSAPLVRGSYSCYRPGQYTRIRGVEGEAVDRLHFAGEHTSLESQGYMNGAVETGERAAQAVLAQFGVPAGA